MANKIKVITFSILSLVSLSITIAQSLPDFIGHWTGTESLESPSITFENHSASIVIGEGGDRDGFFVFTSSSDFLFNDELDWAYHYFGYDKSNGQIIFLRRFMTPLGVLGYEELSYNLSEWTSESFFAEYSSDNGDTYHQIRLDIELLDAIENLPSKFKIKPNFPNPFNPVTKISVHASSNAIGSITIYDILGNEIIKLHEGNIATGLNNYFWNGTDKIGKMVSGGTYIYQLKINQKIIKSHKMTLLK
tara:strand:- start:1400 stop:2143 length:744 start_codon:yes stop_codon:yes gene_type:complete